MTRTEAASLYQALRRAMIAEGVPAKDILTEDILFYMEPHEREALLLLPA